MADKEIELFGFTFSFPCRQLALNKAELIRWTKGFRTRNVVGKDVVSLLKRSCEKLKLKIRDFVVINDTTGTLLCGACENTRVRIGVINGTGTNACYIESSDKVKSLPSLFKDKNIIINTEWGAFGDQNALNDILTDIDKEIDEESMNRGQQKFEKLVSGMYLGEIVRKYLVKINKETNLFPFFPPILLRANSFKTEMISYSYDKIKFLEEFLREFKILLNPNQYEVIFAICDKISIRSAQLLSVGLTALLDRFPEGHYGIAADGSLIHKHPMYLHYVTSAMEMLKKPFHEFTFVKTEDGSGKGAALAACVESDRRHRIK